MFHLVFPFAQRGIFFGECLKYVISRLGVVYAI